MPGITTAPRQQCDTSEAELPLTQLRRTLEDLLTPRSLAYWTDFLVSISCFYLGFILSVVLPKGNLYRPLAAVIAVFALYRAVVFIHELAHLPRDRLPGFRVMWNLLCGIPLLMPSFLYSSHLDHHARRAYGTARDGEYMPWGSPGGRTGMVLFALSSFLGPLAGVLRFGVLAPLSWINPRIRRWVAVNASSLVVNPHYRRDPPSAREARGWHMQEAGVFVYLVAITAGLAAGLIHGELVLRLYLTGAAGLFLNSLRTLAAHRYGSTGEPLTRTEQLLDSLNYPKPSWLTSLWAPVGLRFHATHHLFPAIPYHNLAAAHARIVGMLPPGSPYHRATGYGLVASIADLWMNAR